MTTFNIAQLGELPESPDGISGLTVNKPLEPYDGGSTVEKEYVVIVKKGLTIDELEAELERDTTDDITIDSNIIPDRAVEVANRRPGSDRQTHYFLTYDEAQRLKNHPMVLDVELLPELNPLLKVEPSVTVNQNFTKQDLFGAEPDDTVNYALNRCSSSTNNYGTTTGGRADYEYVADGTGVDVIIMDAGVLPTHPEFQDSNGVSRFQQIDWYETAGGSYTGTAMPAGFYTDTIGHGTHVAGTVAGKTFGWAKNARIYSMNILGATGTTIDTLTAFDLMKLFHRNKPIDPATGLKRPTVVNASWGVSSFLISTGSPYNPYAGHTIYVGYQIWGGNYRGTNWNGYARNTDYGITGTYLGAYTNSSGTNSLLYRIPGVSTSYDAALQELISEGVHFVHAAGNDKSFADTATGSDYNNYVNVITGVVNNAPVLTPNYYNRPGSPWDDECINVGSVDTVTYDATLEKRAFFSHFGPAVDVYAPGVGIVSSYTAGGSPYYWDPAFSQKNDSGTSMASPQAAGVLALFLQGNPGASPAMAKKWMTTNGKGCITSALYSTGLNNDYASTDTLAGGPNNFLFNPYKAPSMALGQNGLIFRGGTLVLKK